MPNCIKQRTRMEPKLQTYPFSNLFIEQISVDSHSGVVTELGSAYTMVNKTDMLLALEAADHKRGERKRDSKQTNTHIRVCL